MLSHRKTLLRRTEYLIAVYVPAAVLASMAVHTGRMGPAQVESKLLLVLAFMVFIAAVWMGLVQEFLTLRHGADDPRSSDTRLTLSDMIFTQRWCPGWLKSSYGLAAVLSLYVFAYIGHVKWSTSAPFRSSDAIGFLLLSSTLGLLALPTIASASRMPGSYAERMTSHQGASKGASATRDA